MHGRVLIVEDDPDMRELVSDELARRGFEPHTSASAEEALARIDERDWEAVLTDMRMPGLEGCELIRRLADMRADIPVVMITAFGTMETAIEALRAGAFAGVGSG